MLWYKAWRQTRSRFLVGLGLMFAGACGIVLYYPEMMKLVPTAEAMKVEGEIGRQIRESVELSRSYPGYIWSQWVRQSFVELGTLFAVLLGAGGSLSQASGAPIFTLALPVTRRQLVSTRAIVGLGEWLLIALIPALVVPAFSPAVGERYPLGDALAYAVCGFMAGAAFYSFACLLSNLFDDLWRPMLIALCAAIVLAFAEPVLFGPSRFPIFATMTGEFYFNTGQLPWPGLILCLVLSAAMLYASGRVAEQRDF